MEEKIVNHYKYEKESNQGQFYMTPSMHYAVAAHEGNGPIFCCNEDGSVYPLEITPRIKGYIDLPIRYRRN